MKIDYERKTEQTDTLQGRLMRLTIKKDENSIKSLVFFNSITGWMFSLKELATEKNKQDSIKILKELKDIINIALAYLEVIDD